MSAASRRTSARRVRRALAIIAATVGVILLLLGSLFWLTFLRPQTSIGRGRSVQIEVARGLSTREIAEDLLAKGVISNANLFRLTSRLSGADGRLKPGVYDLTTGMSARAVIAALESGPSAIYYTVTIPEGFVIEQIAERLEAQAHIPAAEFTAIAKSGATTFLPGHPNLEGVKGGSLEGYLFPKTYRIKKGATAEQVIEMMLDQFDREFGPVDVSTAAARGLSPAAVVVIASMIERESKLDKERPLVSSVIYNRLALNMHLEIDATIEYVTRGNQFRLTNRQLRIDSPYNTYRYGGLPPGPISNPGLASLQAAASPATTAYLYYVLTGKDGSHTFTTNKSDFLLAKQRSKEVFGK